jgi:hypothetical protein
MKAPILTDEKIREVYVSAPALYRSEQDRAVAQTQLDSAHLHYMGIVREIFEKTDEACPHRSGDFTYFKRECTTCWLEVESRFLEEK